MRSARPKVLQEICGRPLALWPVCAALEAGASEVLVVQSPARPLEPLLPAAASSVIQERSDGTGGAVLAAAERINRELPLVVLCGDVPLLGAAVIGALIDAHARERAAATVLTAELDQPAGYGRIIRDAQGMVARIVETKRPGDAGEEELAIREINAGAYVFDPRALLAALPRLVATNAQGELYLTDALALLREQGGRVAALKSADPRVVLGVNDRLQLASVRALAQARINEGHLRAGVDILDPATTYIDIDVQIGPDATIAPGTRLLAGTCVGERAQIGPQVTAIACEIGADAQVRMAWLEHARVGAGARVGPFAYLRPATELGDRAKAGSFVEIKASQIGADAKVPHLSYIGDATVGERANLGAATVTANYDGQRKHRTLIGAEVRTGVDTTLVAPVEVGAGAFTAAGSVITHDVPPGALAVARERQQNIQGYAKRRKERAEDDVEPAPARAPRSS
jgi:bifunctional UDP-N-acetylglucosamine pyrophosphorylase/glucosamine-1-phosphate N-acetyltransferase